MLLVSNVLGSFLVKDKRIVARRIFPRDIPQIASSLKASQESVSREEEELLREFKSTGGKVVYVQNQSRFWGKGFDLEFLEAASTDDVYHIAGEIGVSREEVDGLIGQVNLALTRDSMRKVEEDQDIIQAIGCLDDIEDVSNRMAGRLREWYSLHFPELDHLVEGHDVYVRLVHDIGLRRNFSAGRTGLEPEKEARLLAFASDSLGVDWDDMQYAPLKELAAGILGLYATKKEIEVFIGKRMADTAPNINALAGALLGARVITTAGGLRRLSIMPAGTIQVLGAEDAFFRFLKTGSRPPKHGVIFQLPEIRGAPNHKRGKLARTFAAKLALASRADRFKGSFIGDKLRMGFDARVKSV